MALKLLLLPGDGIGVEVMGEVERLIEWLNAEGHAEFTIARGLVGGCAYDKHGKAISEEDMQKALASDAVIFGAVGGPKWDKVPYEVRPEAGLLRLRKDLGLFANLRPALCYPALAAASSLKMELVEGLHILADYAAMQLGRNPKQLDAMVTDNLFGDVLSDAAAMLTGSLGMLPSASLGAPDQATGKRQAQYEPVHGSATAIAGKGVATPIAMLARFAMALRYSFGMIELANKLARAIAAVLAGGLRTGDIAQGGKSVGTQ